MMKKASIEVKLLSMPKDNLASLWTISVKDHRGYAIDCINAFQVIAYPLLDMTLNTLRESLENKGYKCTLYEIIPDPPAFVIDGICTNNGKHICNLGYACDCCPYNKDNKTTT